MPHCCNYSSAWCWAKTVRRQLVVLSESSSTPISHLCTMDLQYLHSNCVSQISVEAYCLQNECNNIWNLDQLVSKHCNPTKPAKMSKSIIHIVCCTVLCSFMPMSVKFCMYINVPLPVCASLILLPSSLC